MKRFFILVGLVCLFIMLLPACAPSPEPEPVAVPEPVFDQAAEEAAIREMMDQFWAAGNKHDMKAQSALVDEQVEDWTGSVKGRAAYEEYWSDFYERQPNVQHERLEEYGILFVAPNVAVYKFRGENTGHIDSDSKPLPPIKWDAAWVFVKKGGKWLLAAYHNRIVTE